MTLLRLLRRRGPVFALICGGGKRPSSAESRRSWNPGHRYSGHRRATDDLAEAANPCEGLIVVDVTDPEAVAAAVRKELQPHSAGKR